jgi:hypothetical protein
MLISQQKQLGIGHDALEERVARSEFRPEFLRRVDGRIDLAPESFLSG